MDLAGKPNTKSLIWNHFHSCHPSGVCISVFKVHVISNTRLVGCVLVRLSPNWPNTNDTAVNVIHCDSYSTESACSRRGVNAPACLVAEQRTVSKTQQVESVYRTLCQFVISRTRQFTVRDLSCCIALHVV